MKSLLLHCCSLIAASGLGFSATALARPSPAPPNVVFILADDLGWADLGCYGSSFYDTPNLDKLAAQGMRFSDAYAACNVCSPTRASIQTGRYPARLHLTDWLPGRPDRPDQKLNRPTILQQLPLEEITIAEALKKGGYLSCFIGKWHMGGPPYYPEKQGYDINIAGCERGSPPSYFSPYRIPTLKDGPKGEYLTDRLTTEAVGFLENAARSNRPFLLFLSHYAVHTPLQAKPEIMAAYKAKAEKLAATGPEFISDHGRQVRQVQNVPVYAAMVKSLDESVGRVLDTLESLHLDTNTVVLFTSDNGGLSTAEGTPTSNLPLRTGKGWPYDGGVREPLLVKWPGIARPGSTCNTPVISVDYFPTFLEMAGLRASPDRGLDGVSLVPLLQGGTLQERPIYWHYPHYSNQGGPPNGAVRLGDYKLIEWFEDMQTELYDVRKDMGEHTDLSKAMPEKAAALKELLHQWRQKMDAQMPSPNPDYDPDAKPKKAGRLQPRTQKSPAGE